MDNNDKLHEIIIKIVLVIISITLLNLRIDHVLTDENIGAKPWHIRFNKIDGFIRVYYGTSYLVLSGPE